VGCGDDDVRGGLVGHDNVGGKPFQRVCHAFSVGAPGPYPIAMVMGRGRSQIPSLYRVKGPRATNVGIFVDEKFGTRRGSGVRLKSNATFMWDLAESCGLMQDRRMGFTVNRHWGSSLSQRLRGKLWLVEQNPAMK
jgi:hypothetical protein